MGSPYGFNPIVPEIYGGTTADFAGTKETPDFGLLVRVTINKKEQRRKSPKITKTDDITMEELYGSGMFRSREAFDLTNEMKPEFLKGLRQLNEIRKELLRRTYNIKPITYYWRQQLNIIIYLLEELCFKKRINRPIIHMDLVANAIELQQRLRSWDPEEAPYCAIELMEFTAVSVVALNYLQEINQAPPFDRKEIVIRSSRGAKLDKRTSIVPVNCIPDLRSINIMGNLDFDDNYRFYLATFGSYNTKCLLKVSIYKEYRNALTKSAEIRDVDVASAEAVAASVIRSPYVLKVHACFKTKRSYLTIYEPFLGVPLFAIMQVVDYLPGETADVLLAQLVMAVDHIHTRGIIHFDIKATKILVSKAGHLKLLGFEFSKLCLGHHSRAIPLTVFNSLADKEAIYNDRIFTLDYAAPEKLGDSEIGRCSDWWSVGVVGYQMYTGLLPFQQESPATFINSLKYFSWPEEGEHSAQSLAQELIQGFLTFNVNQRFGSNNSLHVRLHPMFGHINMDEIYRGNNALLVPEVEDIFQQILEEREAYQNDLAADSNLPDASYHKPLFTYFSKEYFQAIKEQKTNIDTINYLDVSEGIDRTGLTVPESLISGQLNKLYEGPLKFQLISRTIPRESLENVIKFFKVKGEDGNSYLLVGDIQKDHPVFSTGPSEEKVLIKGDIITMVNGQVASQFEANIPQEWITDKLELELIKDNVFREVIKQETWPEFYYKRGVYMTIQKVFPQEFDTGYCRCNQFGFDFMTYEFIPKYDGAAPFYAHILFYVSESIQIQSPGNVQMFVGDILWTVNGESAFNMDEETLESFFNDIAIQQDSVRIEIGTSSPIRYPRQRRYIVN